jgi:hypothetical protein
MSAKAINATIGYKIKQDVEEEVHREYIAKCARIITENTAKFSSGSYIGIEYSEIIHPKPKDNRTAEEIVADVIEKAGIEVI